MHNQLLVQETAVLQLRSVPGFLQDVIAQILAFLPRLVAAVVILLIGWIVGRLLGRVVRRVTDAAGVDEQARGTPLGRIAGDSTDPVSSFLGTITAWFVYALALLAAADALAIPLLSRWLTTAVSYLPALVGGLLVIVLGFIIADFIGDAIERTRAATHTAYTKWFATGTRLFLYFTAVVIGLSTMGIDVSILFIFARALAYGLAAALAIGGGVALGWGGKDFVAQNIDRWAGQAKRQSPEPGPETSPGDD